MFKRILLPIDLTESEMTARAVARAAPLAAAWDSDIRVVNVQSLLPIKFLDYAPKNFDAEIRRGLAEEIAAVAAQLNRPAGRISTTVRFGPVYQNVLAEADDWSADLIILCSHRPGMDRFLIGSNASAMVRHANCSVLVLRP